MDKKTSENMMKILESSYARKPLVTEDVEKWAVEELAAVNTEKYSQLNDIDKMFLLSHFINFTKQFSSEMIGSSARNEAEKAWAKMS